MEPAPLQMLDRVRARFPLTPDVDADALRAHAEHLTALRSALDPGRWLDVEPAMTFDPTKGTP